MVSVTAAPSAAGTAVCRMWQRLGTAAASAAQASGSAPSGRVMMLVRAPRCGSGVSSGASEASPVAVATCPATALAARRARRAWVLGTCAGKEEGPRSELGVAWALEGAMVRRGLAPRPHGGRACPASACSVSSRCSRRPAAAAPAAASPTSCSAPPSAPPPSASILAGTLGWELGLAQPNWGNLCGPLDLVQQQRPAPSPTVVGNVLPLGITTQTPPFTRGPSCVVPCAALEESGSAASSTVGRSIMPLTFHHAKQLVWQAGRHPAAFCCGMGLATTEDAADGRAREGTHQTSGGGVVGSRAKRGKRCSVGERRHTDTGGKKVELTLGVAQHAQQRRRTHLVSHPLSVTSSAPPTRGPVRLMPGVRQQSQLLPSQAASHRQVLLPSAAKQPPLTGAAAPHSCCSTLGVTCPHAKQEDAQRNLYFAPLSPLLHSLPLLLQPSPLPG